VDDHPEGILPELTARDDRIWHLDVYGRCLKDWDMLNAAIRASLDETALDPSVKHTLRLKGLELLREVDNCD
jgi:hypothetical protein